MEGLGFRCFMFKKIKKLKVVFNSFGRNAFCSILKRNIFPTHLVKGVINSYLAKIRSQDVSPNKVNNLSTFYLKPQKRVMIIVR